MYIMFVASLNICVVLFAVYPSLFILTHFPIHIYMKNGFNPADEHKKKHSNNNKEGKSSSSKTNNNDSLITKARDVFTRVPTLWALFCEILACQGLSTVLNVLTVTKVSEVISDDTERAGWMGNVSIPFVVCCVYGVHLVCSFVRMNDIQC